MLLVKVADKLRIYFSLTGFFKHATFTVVPYIVGLNEVKSH